MAALDYAAQGVRINAIAPGPILTSACRSPAGGQRKAGMVVPVRRLGRPAELPPLWSCSERAAFVTGLTLTVDGSITTGCRRPTR